MANDNDVLFDATVRASVFRERYSKGMATRIINLLIDAEVETLAKLERRLDLSGPETAAFIRGKYTTKRLQLILEQIRDLSKRMREIVRDGLDADLRALVGSELAFSRELLGSVGLAAEVGSGVTLSQAYSIVKAKPMQGRFLREIVKDFEPKIRSRMMATIRSGLITGATTPQIARNLRDEFEVTHRLATTITRTAANHASAVSYLEIFKSMDVSKIRFTSVTDGRTSAYCRAHSNKVYDIDKHHPTIPAHLNCRSVWTPVIPGEDLSSLEKPYVADTRPVSKIPKSERKDKIGRIKGDVDYDTWLRRQSTAFQKQILTRQQYQLFRKGLHLDKFVDSKAYKTYTSAELRNKYSSVLKEAKS